MADKPRNALVDWLVYAAVRFAVCLLQAMPDGVALGFAECLATLAYRVDKRHRKVAAENLTFAFPEKTPTEIDRLVRDCYRHFATLVVEIAVLPKKLRVENWRRYATLVGGEHVLKALLEDRPVLIVTAHFGNWEMAGFALGLFGFQTHAIARTLDNPHLERFFKRFRQRTGQSILDKNDDYERIVATLQAGGKVATLGDQDAGGKGVFIDFFHRPASAHKAVALLALQYDALMLVVGIPRVRSGQHWHYHIACEDVIDPREYTGQGNAVKLITQRYHNSLEKLIRRYPEQYFWLHRRWKSQPKRPPANAAQ
ncbi:MAG: lysophospholipid acyltransferase family protein [Fimbriiglobus sp.]|jgi:KDO2-lipid IV(A) lauroyltransferase|nr:lysophospholipid acyltransferase family protein [Fimbriiglobus sp.]